MWVIEVMSTRDGFAALLGDMRQWLDRNGWVPVAGFDYDTVRNDDAIPIKVQFNDDAFAERFRLTFQGSYAG